MTARIVDPDTGRELEMTETGMVHFRGANIFDGYLCDARRPGPRFATAGS